MLIKKPSDIRPSEITDRGVWEQRRQFLRAAAASTGAALLPLPAIAGNEPTGEVIPGLVKSPLSTGQAPTDWEDITEYNNFYEFGTRKTDPAENAKHFRTRPWTITVSGECEKPGTLGIEELLSGFTQEERIYRLRCVEAWSMVVPWVGFPLGDFIKRFQPTSRAKYVAFTTLYDPKQMPGQKRRILDWPYREGLRMDEAMHPLTLLGTGLYGRLLPNQSGAPIRLVVPWKYGFKSIKSIAAIEFTEQQPVTTWSEMSADEYGFYANVNPEVDHPRWSQKYHRTIGEGLFAPKQKTEMFNGYAGQVAHLYQGMDMSRHF